MSLNGFLSEGSTLYTGDEVPPWLELGVEVVLLVVDAPALEFRDEFELSYLFVAEDDYSMMPVDQVATPVMQLVDPRTMEIVRRAEGVKWDFRDATVNLALDNMNN